MVYIYEQTTGTMVTLTGAANPFETRENENDNIFTPIRYQTGHLRVIDETADGSLMETLMPTNNTQKLVCLYTGTWNSDFTEFADGELKWRGFLCAEAFTQPWDNQKKMIEFPVKSILAAFEDIQIPEGFASSVHNFGYLICLAFWTANLSPTNIIVASNLDNEQEDMLHILLQYSVFFTEETVDNQGDSYQQLVGMSFAEAIGSVASLYGVCLRDNGAGIAIVMYDNGENQIRYENFTWSEFVSIANGNEEWVDINDLSETDMLTALAFRGDDNTLGFIQGARSAKITVNFSVNNDIIKLPAVVQDRSTIYSKTVNDSDILYVQAHPKRMNNYEVFTYIKQVRYTFVEYTDYAEMLACSWINGYTYNPYYSQSTPQVTGVFPCRYFLRKSAEDVPVLKDGLYINYQYPYSGIGTRTIRQCYSIKSRQGFTLSNGWIVIDMSIIPTHLNTDNGHVICNSQTQDTTLYIALRCGSYFYNGSEWVSGSDPAENTFTIKLKGNSVESNKTIDMETDKSSGFFIPADNMVGDIQVYIFNYAYCNPNGQPLQNYLSSFCIIESLDIVYSPRYDMAASNRNSNTYLQLIPNSGFDNEHDANLIVGTINNNKVAPSFIKNSSGVFIESLTYRTNTSTQEERPEINLLGRMVAQYGQVRRTFKAVVQSGLDLITTRYIYLGRRFFGVDAQHNWRDDEQQIKFIEVT